MLTVSAQIALSARAVQNTFSHASLRCHGDWPMAETSLRPILPASFCSASGRFITVCTTAVESKLICMLHPKPSWILQQMQLFKNLIGTVYRNGKTVLVTFPLKCHYEKEAFGVLFVLMITEDLNGHTAAQTALAETLYQRVAVRISELIEHGTLRPGERVPSVRKCSEQQSVSIATIMQAYRLLEDRGVIEARPQSGYYVRAQRWSPPPEPSMSKPAPRAVEVQVSDLVMQVVTAGRDPSLIRLGASLPSPELFPVRELHRALSSVGRRSPLTAHSYDAPPGNQALRVQVARRAMEAGCTLAPDDIVTTVGVTEALNLCLRAVAKPGDVIAIETPTFFGVLHIIEALGMRVCEIPTYPREGICLDELEARLKCCRIKACRSEER